MLNSRAQSFLDEEDRKAAQASLLCLMKAETKRQKQQQPQTSTERQSDQPPPSKKSHVESPWDITGMDFDEKEYTGKHHLESEEEEMRGYSACEPLS